MTGLMDLIGGMVRRGNEAAKLTADEQLETVSSTVRFGGDLRRFLEAQADAMGGVSTQSVVTMILNGVMRETLEPSPVDRVDIVPARIVRLFELHGIDLTTAARILGVPFADMKPERLVNHVDDALLDRLVDDFAIERRWLLGDTSYPGRTVTKWYKSPYHGAQRILELAQRKFKPKVYFVKSNDWDLAISKQEDQTTHRNNILILVELTKKVNPDDPLSTEYKTYELWEDQPWDYQKSRLDILTLVMFCKNMKDSNPWFLAKKKGLDPEYFAPHNANISWTDQQIEKEAFDGLVNLAVLPSQVFQRVTISWQKSGVKSYRTGPWANLDDYLDSSEKSCESKRDNKEYGYVVEQYDDMMKSIEQSIYWKRKEEADRLKGDQEPDELDDAPGNAPDLEEAELAPETQPAAE